MRQEKLHKVYSNLENLRIEFTGSYFRVVFSTFKFIVSSLIFLGVWLICAYFLFSKLATTPGPYKKEFFVYFFVNAVAWGTPLLVFAIGYFYFRYQRKLGFIYLEIDLKRQVIHLPRQDFSESYSEAPLQFVCKFFHEDDGASELNYISSTGKEYPILHSIGLSGFYSKLGARLQELGADYRRIDIK